MAPAETTDALMAINKLDPGGPHKRGNCRVRITCGNAKTSTPRRCLGRETSGRHSVYRRIARLSKPLLWGTHYSNACPQNVQPWGTDAGYRQVCRLSGNHVFCSDANSRASSRRSLPQNISLPTKKVGAPNIPLSRAISVWARNPALTGSLWA
jgi:hypothetical protein